MVFRMAACLFALPLSLVMVSRLAAQAPEADARGTEFFEKRIRPILARHCHECHGPAKAKGGLRLDAQSGWATGGDSGPAIEPGKPDDSLLIQAVRYGGDVAPMPPLGKLPDALIRDLETWVQMGAPDPRADAVAVPAAPEIDIEAGRRFWAYQPLHAVALPTVSRTDWPSTSVDYFILANLERHAAFAEADAGPEVWVRRVYFDLIGLPPTPEQIDELLADDGPAARRRLVDRLLASPAYGERWARHWLDVARFGESVTLRGFVLPDAWRYRDYVLEVFNADRPINEFFREQVAGDLLPAANLEERRRQMAAVTFLLLGNTNFEEQDKAQLEMDVIDEQLDTLGKALLGQTLGCARCHDHKFDPIPTRDYYALAGILKNVQVLEHSNVSKWIEASWPLEPEQEQEMVRHEAAVADLRDRIKLATKDARLVLSPSDLPGVIVDSAQARRVGEWTVSQHTKKFVGDGYLHDQNTGKGSKTLTFSPELDTPGWYEIRFAYSPAPGRANKVPLTVFSADGEQTVHVNEELPPSIDERFVSLGTFRHEADGQFFVLVSNENTEGHVTADALQFLKVEGAGATFAPLPRALEPSVDVKALETELKRLIERGPKRQRVMAVREQSKIADARIHVRGSVHTLGAVAPRGFLQVAQWESAPALPPHESGRRELGDWLASPKNPLTSRVFVNRVWHWLMGSGLVRTTDNFGRTGEAPSHPELLDHLALQFIESGWSTKWLIREIVLSRTYAQSSQSSAAAIAADPENRWFGRLTRRRLDADCLRDALLQLGGGLQREVGGTLVPPGAESDYQYQHVSRRRSLYGPVFRNNLPEGLEVFDFADPSLVVGVRNVSTVAPQALFLLNSRFVASQAQGAADRLIAMRDLDLNARIERAYRLTLGRRPTAREFELMREYLNRDAEGVETTGPWARLLHALMASVDFRFLE